MRLFSFVLPLLLEIRCRGELYKLLLKLIVFETLQELFKNVKILSQDLHVFTLPINWTPIQCVILLCGNDIAIFRNGLIIAFFAIRADHLNLEN
jgi:hypothetical protein